VADLMNATPLRVEGLRQWYAATAEIQAHALKANMQFSLRVRLYDSTGSVVSGLRSMPGVSDIIARNGLSVEEYVALTGHQGVLRTVVLAPIELAKQPGGRPINTTVLYSAFVDKHLGTIDSLELRYFGATLTSQRRERR
jgi:hypothetical protein